MSRDVSLLVSECMLNLLDENRAADAADTIGQLAVLRAVRLSVEADGADLLLRVQINDHENDN